MRNIIVSRIEELRVTKGMTKKNLAKKSGLPKNSVYNWYYTKVVPSLSSIECVCKAFDITLEQFFCGLGKENESKSDNFMSQWRLLDEKEKAAISGMLEAFREIRAKRIQENV